MSDFFPQADFVSIRVTKASKLAGPFGLRLTRMYTFCLQFFQRFFDIVDSQAEAGISRVVPHAVVMSRDDFEQNAIDVEAGNDISRNQLEPQDVPIEANRPLQVGNVVEDAIEVKFHRSVPLPLNQRIRVSYAARLNT